MPEVLDAPPRPAQQSLPFHARLLLFFTAVWFLLALPHVTNAGTGMGWLCLLAPLSFVWLGVWALSIARSIDYHYDPPRETWRVFAACTAVVVLTCGLIFVPYGLTARVWLSAGALEELARSLPREEKPAKIDRCVGLFHVGDCKVSADGAVAVFTSNAGMLNRAGVLYRPPGTTPPPGIRVEEHLYGPWYRFWWKW